LAIHGSAVHCLTSYNFLTRCLFTRRATYLPILRNPSVHTLRAFLLPPIVSEVIVCLPVLW
jgi:hypothetical protein